MILGPQEKILTVDFSSEEGLPQLHEKLLKAIAALEETNGIIVITDVLGGSPFNVANLISRKIESVRVIYGINLPLLLEILLRRKDFEMDELINSSISSGQKGIGTIKTNTREEG